MRLGICTRYCHHEAAYVAVRIADWAEQSGLDVSLFTVTASPPPLVAHWDAVVARNRKFTFTQWVAQQDVILWTHTPPFEQIAWCHGHGRATALLCLWHELNCLGRRAYREVNAVLAPSYEAARFLQARWGIRNIYAAPYDPGLPLTHKPSLPSRDRWVMLPLFDQAPHCMEGTALEIAGRLLCRYDDVRLTVGYNSSTLMPFAKRRLRQFAKAFPERVSLVPRCTLAERPVLMAQHDLLLWPTHAENTGHIGLTALAMGTPVVAFNYPPLTEFLCEENAMTVPCRTAPNDLGVPTPVPNYPAFEVCVQGLLDCPKTLGKLQRAATVGLPERQRAFHEVLGRCLML